LLIGGKVSVATGSSPVISNAGNANNNPARGSRAPSVMTTGASTRSPNRAATRSVVRGAGAASTTRSSMASSLGPSTSESTGA